ncbi:MAG: molybdate ABC transporter substrate-binding protein [Acidobacteriota bacterium]|nr:molybdate ABC transporter substrate-binding protein [Acidobacteriota bacterium]
MMNSGSCNLHPPSLSTVPVILILTALTILPACRQRPPEGGNSRRPEIIVAAAANLTDAFQELSQQFTKQSGINVVLSFGSTADLAKQIENGAPFDVFAAADVAHVSALEQKGLITDGTVNVYARGSLVIWMPAGGKIKLERVEDLEQTTVERIAIAKPDIAPYGLAAIQTLQALNVWHKVEPKVVYAMNVSQAKQFVSSGNAEVGFLPRSLVKVGEGTYLEVDEKLHRPIDQAIGIVHASTRQDEAQRFMEFVLSHAGQEILRKHGYRSATAN